MKYHLPSLILSISFAVLAGFSAKTMYESMTTISNQQNSALDDLKKWKLKYKRLIPVETQWNSSLRSVSQISDVYDIYKIVTSAAETNPDTLTVEDPVVASLNGVSLDAAQLCLMSQGSQGVDFYNEKFSTLNEQMKKLVSRPDVTANSIKYTFVEGKVHATVAGLCILVNYKEGTLK